MSEQISGREVFEFRPELVNDDDEEADDTRYTQGAGGDEVRDALATAWCSVTGSHSRHSLLEKQLSAAART